MGGDTVSRWWGGRVSGGFAGAWVVVFALSCAGAHAHLAAQWAPRSLTLAEALRMAEARSHRLEIAEAGVTRAEGEQLRARSESYPQVLADLSYTRTLASEFSTEVVEGTATSPTVEACGSFTPDPSRPVGERLDSLERAVVCASTGNPFASFGDLPFGQAHRYGLGLSAAQIVYSGGRVQAQKRIADAGRRSAEIAVDVNRAQLTMDVATAYWDATLSDRLLDIAEVTLALAERTQEEVQLAYQLGEEAEFEALRAQVTRDTQQPIVIQRRAERDLAHSRLHQLVGLPLDQPVALATSPEEAALSSLASSIPTPLATEGDTAADRRASVRQDAEGLLIQEGFVAVARSQRLPFVSLSTGWTPAAYPQSGFPTSDDFRLNWTVTAGVSLPLFTGGRIRGDELVAQAGVQEARARLELSRELAAVDARDAMERLQAAQAAWEASSGTVEQAERAYEIAGVRFAEGLSTQLDVLDARLALQQAGTNRAVSARNLQIARLRLALLPYLPVATLDVGVTVPAEIAAPLPAQPRPAGAPMPVIRGVAAGPGGSGG